VDLRGMVVQKDLAEALAEGCATGVSAGHHLQAMLAERVGQQADLR
jgi:hypothetical protein